MNFPRIDPDNGAVLCVELLEMEREFSSEIDIVISLVPLSYGCKRWSWYCCNWTEEQPVDGNAEGPKEERRQEEHQHS